MKVKKLVYQERREEILIYAVFAQFLFLLLQLIFAKFLGESNMYLHRVIMALSALPMVCAFFIWIKFFMKKIVITYVFFLSVLLLHFYVYIDNRKYILYYVFSFFCICIPCFFNIAIVKKRESIKNVLSKICGIMTLMGGGYFLIDIFYKQSEEYCMSFSYYMLWPALYYTYSYFESRKVSRLFLTFFNVGLMMMLGSRGPVISWMIYGVYLFILGRRKTKKDFGIKLFVCLSVLGLLMNIKIIANQMYIFMDSHGMEIRSLRMMAYGIFLLHDSGRGEIYSRAIQAIKEQPICGYGIGSNLYILDLYSHNIFLDLFLHFGLIIGIIISVFMLFLMFVSYKRSSDKKMWFLFMCAGFVPLLVSGIYLEDAPFAIFMGYCVNQIIYKGNNYESNIT